MSYQGGSHKPSHHIERRFVHTGGMRERRFEPGSRVVVRSEPGVPNPYEGRMGEIVGSEAPGDAAGGETVYAVLLDFALPGEEPGVPVPIFASELMQTQVPKAENITVSNAPRPNRRLHAKESYFLGGVRERE
jgi:hypothetical protein